MSENLESQKAELEAICQRLDMGYKELADLGGINRETMRKYIKGYQSMPPKVLIYLRHAEAERIRTNSRLNETEKSSPVALYPYLETSNLMRNFADLAAKLATAGQHDQKYILGNLQAMLDELTQRELTGLCNEGVHNEQITRHSLTIAEETALGGAAAARRLAQESEQKRKAASPTEDKHGQGRASGQHLK